MLLTIEDSAMFAVRLVTYSVIPLCPESPLLQPERCPDCVAHTQATCQPHTGLGKPETTDGIPQLQKLHISTPPRQRGWENKEGTRCVTRAYCTAGKSISQPVLLFCSYTSAATMYNYNEGTVLPVLSKRETAVSNKAVKLVCV